MTTTNPARLVSTTAAAQAQIPAAAERILAGCRRYIAAEARRHTNAATGTLAITRVRAMEVTAELDQLLEDHIYDPTDPVGTGTDTALIKAAAREVSDTLTETHLGPSYHPADRYEALRAAIYQTLTDHTGHRDHNSPRTHRRTTGQHHTPATRAPETLAA